MSPDSLQFSSGFTGSSAVICKRQSTVSGLPLVRLLVPLTQWDAIFSLAANNVAVTNQF